MSSSQNTCRIILSITTVSRSTESSLFVFTDIMLIKVQVKILQGFFYNTCSDKWRHLQELWGFWIKLPTLMCWNIASFKNWSSKIHVKSSNLRSKKNVSRDHHSWDDIYFSLTVFNKVRLNTKEKVKKKVKDKQRKMYEK